MIEEEQWYKKAQWYEEAQWYKTAQEQLDRENVEENNDEKEGRESQTPLQRKVEEVTALAKEEAELDKKIEQAKELEKEYKARLSEEQEKDDIQQGNEQEGRKKVNKNNLPVKKKDNIVSRIVIFLKKIFNSEGKERENRKISTLPMEERTSTENANNSFTERVKFFSTDFTVELQKDYEAGIIKEENLTEEQYNNLMELYNKQIDNYKTSINMKKAELENYKNRITQLRKKLA